MNVFIYTQKDDRTHFDGQNFKATKCWQICKVKSNTNGFSIVKVQFSSEQEKSRQYIFPCAQILNILLGNHPKLVKVHLHHTFTFTLK